MIHMSPEMVIKLQELLQKYAVCIISGGKYEQFQVQVLQYLCHPNLHIMPTSGTCYYKYDDEWQLQYEENLTIEEKHKIIDILTTHHNGLWPE